MTFMDMIISQVVNTDQAKSHHFPHGLYLGGKPVYAALILKEISPEYSLEGLMLKLKLQSFGHLR